MVSSLARKAKEKYLELYASGVVISLADFAARAEEILDQPISYDQVRHWSMESGWSAAAKAIQLAGLDSYKESRALVEAVYSRIEKAQGPKELAELCGGYAKLLEDLPESILAQEEGAHIESLIVRLEEAILDRQTPSFRIKRLTEIRATLRKKLSPDLSVLEEYGTDADALLMGLEDGT